MRYFVKPCHPILLNLCRQTAVCLACFVAVPGAVLAQQAPATVQAVPAQQMDPQLDPQLTSRTIAATGQVTATVAHPWAGFWKLSCKDEFGLALVAAKPGVYSVLFCGPFACSRPGTFQPDTALVGDPAYRLDDVNQIGFLDKNGNYRLHARCVAPR